ncbi:hypothetical protein Q1695_014796 [Nippostrongylus brasiliensis]|nr:hypothetical protein Q1695_014796 [Nippostrongylus brasiliensis]
MGVAAGTTGGRARKPHPTPFITGGRIDQLMKYVYKDDQLNGTKTFVRWKSPPEDRWARLYGRIRRFYGKFEMGVSKSVLTEL